MDEKALIAKYSKLFPGMSVLFPIENWFQFITSDGVELYTYKYPAQNPKCVLISLHGMNSYSQPTGVIARTLSEKGCEVLAFDFRGHGKSQGIKGYCSSLDLWVEDVLDFIQEIIPIYPGLPLFVMGGSLGAAITVRASIEKTEIIRGIVMINPALGLNTKFEGYARGISNCLAACCPMLPLYKGDMSYTTKNETLRKFMRENPFYYNGKIRIGTSAAILNGMQKLRKEYKKLKNPVLVIQGNDDHVISLKEVQNFMKEINVNDKTLLMYPGRPHSIVFEDAVFEIANKIADWVIQRV